MVSGSSQLNSLIAKLEAGGRRVTPQRVAVCELLLQHEGHPTAGEIWRLVQQHHPAISQATVYNTLAALTQLGLAQALDIAGDEHTHYDLCAEPHVNVVCTSCGRIADVHTDTLEALLGLVANRSGYQIEARHGVIVYGLCEKCRASR